MAARAALLADQFQAKLLRPTGSGDTPFLTWPRSTLTDSLTHYYKVPENDF